MDKTMKERWLCAVSLVIFSLTITVPAFAGTHKIGNVEIIPHASVIEGWDDNISFVKTNEKSDYSATLRLGIDAKYEGHLEKAGLSANVQRQMFNSNTNFDNTSMDILANYG
ncbi:MAG: hypothetical protein WCY10_06990, partial [Candidatus Omnitrophota bacterium]